MDQEIRQILEKLNGRLQGVMPYKLYLAHISEIDFLDKNARYMTKEQFSSLTANIKKDKALSSVPLVWRQENGRLLVLSGNHRIKAAAEAGVEEFLVLVDDRTLSRQERLSVQLSHNALQGQDDEQILKELWAEIDELECKIYSGFTTEMIEKLKSSVFSTIKEEPIHYEEVSLLFLPEDLDRMKGICEDILAKSINKITFTGRITEYNSILDGMIAAKQNQNIINSTLAFFSMAKVVNEYMEGKVDDLKEAMEEGLEDTVNFTLGSMRKRIAKETAKKLRKRIKEMMETGADLDKAIAEILG
ncbi:MAG: ParB N-terminal domain-containing protein [Deltaproteobacteria bacterium]|nr:ParB N-terminal domain-containing protein [Deltaproteobacteria bacterium]